MLFPLFPVFARLSKTNSYILSILVIKYDKPNANKGLKTESKLRQERTEQCWEKGFLQLKFARCVIVGWKGSLK